MHNAEKAELRKPKAPAADPLPMEEVATPGQKTIEELCAFLGVEAIQTLKAVFYMAEDTPGEWRPVFVAIRGDLEVNEVKLKNALHALDLRAMTDPEVRAAGLVAGSASPVGVTNITVVADDSVLDSPNLVAGANQRDVHLRNVNYPRDWQAQIVTDIALARPGDLCARCGGIFEAKRVAEIGHVFKLGTRYTEKMNATFLDAGGQEQLAIMGCYGIGTTRLLHCVIEANHDERGIIWPATVAPYDVHLVGLNLDRGDAGAKAEALEAVLNAARLDVLYDDRPDVSAGVKFNDADLIGLPVRVTVSPRSLEKGSVEVKLRSAADLELVPYDDAVARIKALLGR